MRATVDIPDDLLRRAEAQAALEGQDLNDLIMRYVERGLAADSASPAAARRRLPIPTIRPPTGETLPLLSNEEIERLLVDEEAERAPRKQ